MSTFAYREPYRLSAGVLTLLTHALFFALLYLGVNWHFESPQGMEVELWASLPEPAAAPPVVIPPPPVTPEPARPKEAEVPAPPAKADIELAQKKKPPVAKPRETPKPEKKAPSKAQQEQAAREMQAQLKAEEQAEQQEQAAREKAAAQAAQARAAIASEVDKYKGLIRAKIRRKLVMPPDVPDDAVAEFVITLLPDGSLVADPKLVKSSGNAAYDGAVERAIRGAEPLPLPKDEDARTPFINPSPVRLKFSPKDAQ